MAAPKRPEKKKPAKSTVKGTGSVPKGSPIKPEVEENEVVEVDAVLETETTETVDKDALIKSLQDDIRSKEEQSDTIKELQKQLAEAEAKAGSSAAIGSEEFKTRPDPEVDDEKYFYFEINWHPKRSDSDEEFVTIGVNGKMMIWPRNKPTVIRSDYLEVADNAFVPKFKQLPGEERKEIGGLKPYTYTINRKITEEEYTKRKKDGDKALRDDLANKGMSL